MAKNIDSQDVENNLGKEKRPCYMWVALVVLVLAVAGIIAVIVYIDSTKDDENRSSGASEARNRHASNYTVLVLGAGISGIRAAQVLSEVGVNVRILEGSDRIGGRIKNVDFGGVKLEVGATWVYGSSQENPIRRYMEKVNLTTTLTNYENYMFRSEAGEDVTDEADELYGLLEEVVEKMEELQRRKVRNNEQDISIRKAMEIYGWNPQSPVMDAMEYFDYEFEYAVNPDVMPLIWNVNAMTSAQFGDSEHYIVDQRGFSVIVDEIAGEFLEKNDSRLHLNTVVTEVNYTSSGVKVMTLSGEMFEADYAVCTFSMGVLQSDAVKFSPEMPRWKREAIFSMEMGYYAHIFFKFNETFWDDVEWLMHAHQQRGYYPIFSGYDQHRTPQQIQESGLSHILMLGVTGPEAYRVTSLPDDVIKQEVMSVLRRFYGDDIPEPSDVIHNPWIHDPLFRGSFSNKVMGFTMKSHRDLNAPLDRLYFAGDGYSLSYDGYAHGAYFSGEDQAVDMLACMMGEC